ncbi:uncharacterized protein LOC108242329 isoform X1 [Kryptolebias marmoratus]|uniref:uncharacterized protein LOC108242329 isoform X1 n=1 Tax=Kryptolebias marmoratus TaxID=37003 RepID=UPI0007F8EE4C|nr:uncharacterized protein LOC108242329 isoform X1 [Kryptolebias marmoratus]
MLVLVWVVFGVSCGFASEIPTARSCYDHRIELPTFFFIDSVYLTPSDGRRKEWIIKNGKANDPRIRVCSASFCLTGLTKRDNGVFSVSKDGVLFQESLRLEVLDCTETISVTFMKQLEHEVPTAAKFMDYISLPLDEPIILWNRTDPRSNDERRGKVINNVWRISDLTQADNGYYNFWRKNNFIESRIFLEVKEDTQSQDLYEGDSLVIKYPPLGGPWTVIFKTMYSQPEELVKEGQVIWDFHRFSWRIKTERSHFEIESLKEKDSGTFELRDSQGHLALSVELNVSPERDEAIQSINRVIFVCAGAVIVGIFCCVCCCCLKKSCKNDSSVPQLRTVHYHDDDPKMQPSPAFPAVYSHQPGYQPANIYSPQPGINVNPPQPGINVNPPQPGSNISFPQIEVAPQSYPGPMAAPTFSSDFLSSDAEPRFELKGFSVPSANPLSSDTPSCDVYTSEKLEFL